MAKLKDVCDKITDGSHNPPQGINHSQYLMLSSKNIADDRITFENPRYLTEEDFVFENKRTAIKIGDLLLTIVGTVGRAAVVPPLDNEICLQRSVAVLKPKHGLVESRFLMYQLQHMRPILEMEAKGVAQKGIYLKQVENLEVSIPPLETQKQIAATLDKVTALIDMHKRQLELLDELVKSRFVELFGSLNSNEKGLDIASIEELCTLIKDGTHQTPAYTDDKQNGFKFLSSKDVMTQKICWDEIKYIPAELHEKLYATIQPKRNDILMSKNGVNYGVAAVNDTDEIFDIYVSLALLRPRTDRVHPVYLRCAINNPDTKHQFDSSIKGIGVPNLHLGEIKKTKVLVPPMDKQNEFIAFVEQTDKSKLAVQQSLEKLETLKKSLMQQYFE